MFTDDDLFWLSLWRLLFAGLGVPLGILGSMFLAIFAQPEAQGISVYRTLFFMPSLVPLVAGDALEMAARYQLWHCQSNVDWLGHE
ncbi:MAG: hypothetical protein R2911_00615 [Caldilineaceae bacterium]